VAEISTEFLEALQVQASDGPLATQILENPLWQRIYKEHMDIMFQGYLSVSVDDTDRMKDLVISGKMMRKLQNKLEDIAEIGGHARNQMEVLEKEK